MRNLQWVLGWCVVAGGLAIPTTTNSGAAELDAQLRRPVAMFLSADEQRLVVAQARSGRASVVDWQAGKIVAESPLGRKLSAIRPVGDGPHFLATDEATHQLLGCSVTAEGIEVFQRLPVSPYPVDVVVSGDRRRAFVSSLWSHRVTAIDLASDGGNAGPGPVPALSVVGQLDLPFAPRCMILVRGDSRLIVADAFGGDLAVIDTDSWKLLHVRTFPSHNIRGLGTSPDGKMLLIAHQMLNELAHTINNDVHWGLLMSNDLRWLTVESVLHPTADLYDGAHMHPLGHAGDATGDPSGIAVATNGVAVVALGGIDEIAFGRENDFSFHRVAVGRRPVAVTTTRDGQHALVANLFGDSISVVDLGKRQTIREIGLGPQAELSLVDRGELLFYDARLSHDGWMSCHSCHTDGHTNGLLNDNFSDGSFGAPKRVLSLAGQTDTAPFAWNAQVDSLEAQIRNSVANTMQKMETPSEPQVTAMAAFIRSIPLPPPLSVARGDLPAESVARGKQLFSDLQCVRCHAPPTYTTAETYDVGLHDKQGNKRFNPPSLRSVSQRGPFFHDNRAETLEAVFQEFHHQLDRELADGELRDLVAFLKQL